MGDCRMLAPAAARQVGRFTSTDQTLPGSSAEPDRKAMRKTNANGKGQKAGTDHNGGVGSTSHLICIEQQTKIGGQSGDDHGGGPAHRPGRPDRQRSLARYLDHAPHATRPSVTAATFGGFGDSILNKYDLEIEAQ